MPLRLHFPMTRAQAGGSQLAVTLYQENAEVTTAIGDNNWNTIKSFTLNPSDLILQGGWIKDLELSVAIKVIEAPSAGSYRATINGITYPTKTLTGSYVTCTYRVINLNINEPIAFTLQVQTNGGDTTHQNVQVTARVVEV